MQQVYSGQTAVVLEFAVQQFYMSCITLFLGVAVVMQQSDSRFIGVPHLHEHEQEDGHGHEHEHVHEHEL